MRKKETRFHKATREETVKLARCCIGLALKPENIDYMADVIEKSVAAMKDVGLHRLYLPNIMPQTKESGLIIKAWREVSGKGFKFVFGEHEPPPKQAWETPSSTDTALGAAMATALKNAG